MSTTLKPRRRYRLALLLTAVAVFITTTFVSTMVVRKPANASTTLSMTPQGALARAQRYCTSNGRGYQITTSAPVYNATRPFETIYVDANCTSAGQRTVRLLADVHSNYVWNDRDGALYYIR